MPRQNEKILVVDADPNVLKLVAQQVLAPQGYQVGTAADGNTALQLAFKMSPDILIVSLELPGLSGKDLLAALRSQGFESIIIATGPKGSEPDALQAFRLGARDYLTKPLREAELVSSIDHALEEVRLRREREQLSQRLGSANQQLERQVKELTTLYGIGKVVAASTDLAQLFMRLLEGALFVTEAELGWIVLADEGTGKLILRAGKNLPNLNIIKLNQPWDDGLSSLLMMSGEGLTLAGEPLAKLRAGQVVKAAAAVPLKAKEQVLGVMVVGNKSGKPFADRDQALLSAVADYASIALVNAHLFQALETRARFLQKSYDDLAAQVSGELSQTKNLLEQIARGETGPLTAAQAQTTQTALEKLRGIQRLMEAAQRAPAGSPG